MTIAQGEKSMIDKVMIDSESAYIKTKLKRNQYADIHSFFKKQSEELVQEVVKAITGINCVGNSNDASYNVLVSWHKQGN